MTAPAVDTDERRALEAAELYDLYALLRRAQGEANTWGSDATWYVLGATASLVHDRYLEVGFPADDESAPTGS